MYIFFSFPFEFFYFCSTASSCSQANFAPIRFPPKASDSCQPAHIFLCTTTHAAFRRSWTLPREPCRGSHWRATNPSNCMKWRVSCVSAQLTSILKKSKHFFNVYFILMSLKCWTNVVRAAAKLICRLIISCRLLAAPASLGATPQKTLWAWRKEENSVCVFFVPRTESCSGSRVRFVWSVARLSSKHDSEAAEPRSRLWSNKRAEELPLLFFHFLFRPS